MHVAWSSQRELMKALFPLKFERVPDAGRRCSPLTNLDSFVNEGYFLNRDEMSALITICKNFKVV